MCFCHSSPRPRSTQGQMYKVHFAAWCFSPPSNIFLLSRSRTLDEAGPQVVSHSIKVSTFWHLHFAGAWDFQKQPYLSGYICYQGKSRRNQERGGSVICMKVVPYFLVYARGFCPKMCMPTPPLGQTLLGSHRTLFTSSGQ